jgi:hypothetical protein
MLRSTAVIPNAEQLFATCNVGLEFVVAAEVREKLGARAAGGNARTLLDQSGKCFFGIDNSRDITEVLQALASPEQVYALLLHMPSGISYDEGALAQLHDAAASCSEEVWGSVLDTWKRATGRAPDDSCSPTFCVRACRRERRAKHAYNRHQVEVEVRS